MYENDIEEILISEEQIREKVFELGRKISKDYQGKKITLITILKGGFIFASDLMRAITTDVEIDFMAVSSYGASTKTSGIVKVTKDLDKSVEGKDVLFVEDIIDSGLTLAHIKEMLTLRNANSIKICTLLNKPSRRKIDINIDYIGFEVPDEFIVGYGLDYAERYRNLPYIGLLKSEIVQN